MTSLKMANRRIGSLFAVAALVLATVTPGLVPAFASAAQVTERSVELSSASREADNVQYKVSFKPVSAAAAVVLDFCNDTPLIGASCTPPAGFDVSAATVSGSVGLTLTKGTGAANDENTVVVNGTLPTSPISVILTGVENPDNAGPLYVRIATYGGASATTSAGAYTSNDLGDDVVDQGSAAASITDTVGVSASVLESMTFCVTGNLLDGDNCTTSDPEENPILPPVVQLGEGTGSLRALSSSVVSEGSIYSQISTNAANGAVVALKSSTSCGGLKRVVATGCDIAPAGSTGFESDDFGQAKFGVRVATAANPNSGANSTGEYQIFGSGGETPTPFYSSSVFKLAFDEGAETGVTSPYGDKLLDTNGQPVNNKNVQIIFGASAANNTPAGTYATDLSLIATGKF